MLSVAFYDDLIRDYLLFRGFTSTLKAFEAEIKLDKDKGFRVDRIVDQFTAYIASYDLTGLKDTWNHFNQRIFARLEHQYLSAVRKLENGLLKMYVVNAVQTNRHDKLLEFFEKMGPELQNQPEWKEWFVLPFVKSPEDNPAFAVYFTKQWQDTLLVSLNNFLSVVFYMFRDTPALLSYQTEQTKITKLVQENETLKQKIADLQGKEKYEAGLSSEDEFSGATASSELMDDFYIIAQEAPPADNQNKSIRSFIKNISSGLPTSPILGRKHSTTTSQLTSASSVNLRKTGSEDINAPGKSVTSLNKTKTSSLSTTAHIVTRRRPSSESDTVPKPAEPPQTFRNKEDLHHKVTDTMSKMGLSEASSSQTTEMLNQPSRFNSRKIPFIILSQEEYFEHNSAITHCKFNASGSMIASSDISGVIKVWSPCPTPQTLATIMSKSNVLALEWANKMEKLLLIGNRAGTVRLYDTKDKRTLCEVALELRSSQDIRITCLASSPNETAFVCCAVSKPKSAPSALGSVTTSASSNGRLMIWDMKTMKLEKTLTVDPFSSAINCSVFNHNGQLLLVGDVAGRISLFDMRSYECLAIWQGHEEQAYTVQFSTDETSCYSLGKDGIFNQWSVNKTGQKLMCLPLHEGSVGPFVAPVPGTLSKNVAYHPLGKLFASDSEGKYILTCSPTGGIIYSIAGESPQPVLFLGGHKSPVATVDWSTAVDCGTCVTASLDANLRVTTMLSQK